jgi:hypothetical protein
LSLRTNLFKTLKSKIKRFLSDFCVPTLKGLTTYGLKGTLIAQPLSTNYWKDIGANEFILGTISEGYVIPFSSNPPSIYFKNNKSAFQNHDFVDTAIAELVDNGCAIKVPSK